MRSPVVPEATLRSFALVPGTAHAALLLRHGHRGPLPPNEVGDDVDLTLEGAILAEELGVVFRRKRAGRLSTSSVSRCVKTACAIARGANWSVTPTSDWRLGRPGVFVVDSEAAWRMFMELGTVKVVDWQLSKSEPPPGMRATQEGVKLLVEAMSEHRGAPGQLDVLVTHDALLAVVVGQLFGLRFEEESWPAFLEGMFLWRVGERVVVVWRGEVREVTSIPDRLSPSQV